MPIRVAGHQQPDAQSSALGCERRQYGPALETGTRGIGPPGVKVVERPAAAVLGNRLGFAPHVPQRLPVRVVRGRFERDEHPATLVRLPEAPRWPSRSPLAGRAGLSAPRRRALFARRWRRAPGPRPRALLPA